MKLYTQFHGDIPISNIGKELRSIAVKKESFKVLTGYGSSSGLCKSKSAALKSLSKMRKEGLIKDFIPGEKVTALSFGKDDYYRDVRQRYSATLSSDSDRGNDGIIYVFI